MTTSKTVTNPALETLLRKIGRRIYSTRHTRNEKLATVARATSVSHSIISRIENGTYDCLSFDMLLRITTYYKIDIHEVLAG